MSKTQLKKTLQQMSSEQISELVIELYDARSEAKEYLEFFLNPDLDTKLEKVRAAIKKEVNRQSRGRNRARATRLRRFIKDFSSFNPGAEPIADVMTYTMEQVCKTANGQMFKTSTQMSLVRLLHDTVLKISDAGMLDHYLPRLQKAIDDMESHWYRSNEFKKALKSELQDTLEVL